MKTYLKTAFALALGGTLFAGYLSAKKLFTGTCAFDEACPYLFGYPTCVYGFAMFLSMTLVSGAGVLGKLPPRKAARANAWIALAGTMFAGYYTVTEVVAWLARPAATRYGLVLPTCAYGLAFYVLILALSVRAVTRRPASPGPASGDGTPPLPPAKG